MTRFGRSVRTSVWHRHGGRRVRRVPPLTRGRLVAHVVARIADARALDEARVRAEAEAAAAAAAAGEAELTLHEYSGLVLKAIGDGQVYTAILRTAEYATTRVEWHADFATKEGSFVHARLPFSTFTPHRDGRPINAAAAGGELDRRAVRDIALAYFPVRNGPELSLIHI